MAEEDSGHMLLDDNLSVLGNMSNGNFPPNTEKPSSHLHSSFSNLRERFEFIFNHELYCNVGFIVGRAQENKIRANKFILSARSLVFHNIFSNNWRDDGVIEVPDFEPDVFSELLKYVYSEKASLTADRAVALLHAAKKYAVVGLETRCCEWLDKNLCAENAFVILTQALWFNHRHVINASLKIIDDFTGLAMEAAGFYDINNKTLCSVLARNSLRIKEIDLFQAVVRWAKAKCISENLPETVDNLKLVLRKALLFIRFTAMSVEEFGNQVVDSGLLSEKEQLSVLLYAIKNPKPAIKFNPTPRLNVDLKEKDQVSSISGGIANGQQCGNSGDLSRENNETCPDGGTVVSHAYQKSHLMKLRKHRRPSWKFQQHNNQSRDLISPNTCPQVGVEYNVFKQSIRRMEVPARKEVCMKVCVEDDGLPVIIFPIQYHSSQSFAGKRKEQLEKFMPVVAGK